MKLSVTLLLVFFINGLSNAQSYQCLKPDSINIFLNGNGYIRGMRIDSVRSSGSGDTNYYPYHSPRGTYYSCDNGVLPLDKNGGSWLGKKVIRQANGTFLFDNMWHDTVVIRTQANIGDSWAFFNDTTNVNYKATVTAISTMVVLGTMDSVKTIRIEADSAGLVNVYDPVNNFEIKLSKHNGFVQIFDLYTFPYHKPDSIMANNQFYDYYLDLVLGNLGTHDASCYAQIGYSYIPDTNNSIFRLTGFHNPTEMEFYDFAVNDVYESSNYDGNSTGAFIKLILDTVLTKTVGPFGIDYSMRERTNTTMVSGSGTAYVSSTNLINSLHADTTVFIDYNKMPEEWGTGYFYHYLPALEVSGVCDGVTYTVDKDNIEYSSATVQFQQTDFNKAIGNSSQSYRPGYGLIHIQSYNYQFNHTIGQSYVYIIKEDTICGGYEPVIVTDIVSPNNTIAVYPIPAKDQLNIQSSAILNEVVIRDLLGQLIYKHTYNDDRAVIDINSLASGVYLLRINGTQIRKFIKQ